MAHESDDVLAQKVLDEWAQKYDLPDEHVEYLRREVEDVLENTASVSKMKLGQIENEIAGLVCLFFFLSSSLSLCFISLVCFVSFSRCCSRFPYLTHCVPPSFF